MPDGQTILAHLRSASEADVETVLALPGLRESIEYVSSEDLLIFFNRMLDLLLA
jgi:hypothetical protein